MPHWPGVVTAGDTIDEAMQQAAELLAFASEGWETPDGIKENPKPRTIDNCVLVQSFAMKQPKP